MKDLRKAAAETGQAAAERSAAAFEDAKQKIQPLVEQAGDKVAPLAHQAKVKSADFASRTLEAIQPGLDAALDKISPAVESAQSKLQDDFLPKLQELLDEAAEHPAVEEVSKRGGAAVAALKGEVEPPKKSRVKGFFKGLFKLVAITAVLAGAVAAVRQFLLRKDDGWTAHEPSKAYVNTTDTFAEAKEESDAADARVAAAEAEEEAVMAAEGGPADEAETTAETSEFVDEEKVAEASQYGEGSFVGENPPEGFDIKGNERSMKYHVHGTGGYERTIADVWFNSEEAAQAAGFTKAQR